MNYAICSVAITFGVVAAALGVRAATMHVHFVEDLQRQARWASWAAAAAAGSAVLQAAEKLL